MCLTDEEERLGKGRVQTPELPLSRWANYSALCASSPERSAERKLNSLLLIVSKTRLPASKGLLHR